MAPKGASADTLKGLNMRSPFLVVGRPNLNATVAAKEELSLGTC